MNIAFAYCNSDREQAVRWMNWVKELGGLGNHKLYTICAFDCEPIPDILPQSRIIDSERVPGGDWQTAIPARSAAAPNSMFRMFAWKFYLEKLGPWLWIEPDAIPLKPGWIDSLEAEYQRGGKPFCGAYVTIDKVPPHLTGNSIYPQDVPALSPTLIMRTNWISEGREYELAFDVAGAREVLKQCHFTNLIQHVFRHKGFKTREEFEALIDPNAVMFHSNKDGSIYPFLRDNLSGVRGSGSSPVKAEQASNPTLSSASAQTLERKEGDAECDVTAEEQDTQISTTIGAIQSSQPNTNQGLASNGAATVQPSAAPALTLKERRQAQAAHARAVKAAKAKAGTDSLSVGGSNGEETVTIGSPHVTSRTFGVSPELIQRALNEPTMMPAILPPWENKADSLKEIKQYAAALRVFCTAPSRIKTVRDELRSAGVIK